MMAVVVLLVIGETSQAGYPLTHWAPAGLIVLALLGIAIWSVPLQWRRVPSPVALAVLCLAAYTALSFLSILWAGVKADAWEGADRTLLYLLVFTLFACWAQNGRSAGLLLCTWVLATIGVALYIALRLDLAAGHPGELQSMLPDGRLVYPAGYVNAAPAQWMMAAWVAVLLSRAKQIHWGVRGLLAGGTVLLAEVALLSQSRGSLYATPIMLVLVFVLLPGRVRTFSVLVPVAVGIGAATPALLRVGKRLEEGHGAQAAIHTASLMMLGSAVLVGLLVGASAALEHRRTLSESSRIRLHRGVGGLALVALVVVLAGGLVAAGNPVARVRHEWATFKSGSGYAANGTGNRLISGLGSNRYDFYRVALDEFLAHPVLGIGADNFAQQYLQHGRSTETPKYPHSVELRTLAQTGAVGTLLALLGLSGALLAAARAMRRTDQLARLVTGAALAGFAYWVVQGSFDWFWEFAGLGASAFALLGLGCALAPRAHTESALGSAQRSSSAKLVLVLVCALLALACGASLAAPWLSELEVQRAARVWVQAPLLAYERLRTAARLNPLSDQPAEVAGDIALRLGDLRRAKEEFTSALQRTPGDAYATLELGAIASNDGQHREALRLLTRAVWLAPREPLTAAALRAVRHGERVDVEGLNRAILLKAQQLL